MRDEVHTRRRVWMDIIGAEEGQRNDDMSKNAVSADNDD